MITERAAVMHFPAIVSLAQSLVAESQTRFPEIEPGCLLRFLDTTLSHPAQAFAAVAVVDDAADRDTVAGFVLAMAAPHLYAAERAAQIHTLYVHPAHRGGRAAMGLVRAALDWARAVGAATAYMGVSTGIQPDRTERFLLRHGFAPTGRLYALDLATLSPAPEAPVPEPSEAV